MKPATRRFDESFAPMLHSDKRFARQYCDWLPPQFPMDSPWQSIVHHLSGPATACSYSTPCQIGDGSVAVADCLRFKPDAHAVITAGS